EMPTSATNIVPWGVLIAGEELHNNHHAFPSSPRFAVQRWEIDMGWLVICVFRALGLARVGSLAPTPNIVHDRTRMDLDTVRALFTNRMHVLRDYRCGVIGPVFRELTKQESTALLPRRAPQLLVRHPKLLDERPARRWAGLLEQYEVVQTVMNSRAGWERFGKEMPASHGRALEQLREL